MLSDIGTESRCQFKSCHGLGGFCHYEYVTFLPLRETLNLTISCFYFPCFLPDLFQVTICSVIINLRSWCACQSKLCVLVQLDIEDPDLVRICVPDSDHLWPMTGVWVIQDFQTLALTVDRCRVQGIILLSWEELEHFHTCLVIIKYSRNSDESVFDVIIH
ncbi:hypothetical protein [Salmon gill poxvirus]|nr:hypothetical protein [Salmon gill poxvirus]